MLPAAPRRPQLEQYWEALEPAVQAAAAADASVAQILRDLSLDALLGAVAFGEQVSPRPMSPPAWVERGCAFPCLGCLRMCRLASTR